MKNNNLSVISIVIDAFIFDSRVLKTCKSLQKAGFEGKVVAFHQEPLKEFDIIQDASVHRIKLKTRFLRYLKYFEFIYRITRY